MSYLCRKTKDTWELVLLHPHLPIRCCVCLSLQAVRVTKPNIPEAIRRNYELM